MESSWALCFPSLFVLRLFGLQIWWRLMSQRGRGQLPAQSTAQVYRESSSTPKDGAFFKGSEDLVAMGASQSLTRVPAWEQLVCTAWICMAGHSSTLLLLALQLLLGDFRQVILPQLQNGQQDTSLCWDLGSGMQEAVFVMQYLGCSICGTLFINKAPPPMQRYHYNCYIAIVLLQMESVLWEVILLYLKTKSAWVLHWKKQFVILRPICWPYLFIPIFFQLPYDTIMLAKNKYICCIFVDGNFNTF